MDVKDFRVGNYYKADLEIEGSIEAKLGFGECREFLMTKNHLKLILQFDLEPFIKPIPLTEEWLVKFGFKVYAKGSIAHGWQKGINPLTKDYLVSLTWMHNDDGTKAELFYRNGNHILRHVHQLQNLYHALIGEELKIK